MITQPTYETPVRRRGHLRGSGGECNYRAMPPKDLGLPGPETDEAQGLKENESHLPLILLVDDDQAFGLMLVNVITRLTGYDCLFAADAERALENLEQNAVDVVITDIKMPDMNGLELTRIIREKYDADIIVITGFYENFTYEESIGRGANDFIEKPVRPTELVIRLRRVLRERTILHKCRKAEENLRKINRELEKRISEGNEELSRANALLRKEITAHEAAEEALRKSEERYRLATKAALEGIWDIDLINGTMGWNEMFSIQFGSPSGMDLSWQWWIDRFHPGERDCVISSFTGALKGDSDTWSKEYRFLRPDGSYADVFNRAFISRNEKGKATNVYGALLDVTSLRQVEKELTKQARQLEQANEELESFGYSVSHDLREPLRAIDGYARMLARDLEDRVNSEAKHRFDVIREKIHRMDQLIAALLDFSRLRRREVVKSVIDMERLANESWREIRDSHPNRDITLNIARLPGAYGEYNLIRQVLINLLSNAVKFTPVRRKASIEVGGLENPVECLYFVKDNGIGFDMKYCHKLFGLFQRLHKDEEYEGTGVGLAFVKAIVERHGGRIWAEAGVDEGATFYFTLPVNS